MKTLLEYTEAEWLKASGEERSEVMERHRKALLALRLELGTTAPHHVLRSVDEAIEAARRARDAFAREGSPLAAAIS